MGNKKTLWALKSDELKFKASFITNCNCDLRLITQAL